MHVKNEILFDHSKEVVDILILFILNTFKFSFLRQIQLILTMTMTNDHVILEIHLVPQDGCKCFKKLTYKHVSYVYTKTLSTRISLEKL